MKYYDHKANSPGGRDACVRDAAVNRLSEIKEVIRELNNEAIMWEHILKLTDHVCKTCGGEGTIGWLPPGATRGQGLYRHMPCSTCRPLDYVNATTKYS